MLNIGMPDKFKILNGIDIDTNKMPAGLVVTVSFSAIKAVVCDGGRCNVQKQCKTTMVCPNRRTGKKNPMTGGLVISRPEPSDCWLPGFDTSSFRKLTGLTEKHFLLQPAKNEKGQVIGHPNMAVLGSAYCSAL